MLVNVSIAFDGFSLDTNTSTNAIADDASGSGLTCANSEHKSWLVTSQKWWTRSANPNSSNFVWIVYDGGLLGNYNYLSQPSGVRPVITISKDAL